MDKLKKYCYLIFILLLLAPVAQRFLKFTVIKPLNLEEAVDFYPDFHVKTWFKGEYQAQTEEFINKNFGFRGHLVRFLNQIDFYTFSKSNGYQVVVGKNKHLFFDYNIESYLGINHINLDSMEMVMRKTGVVIDSLKTRNIEFLFVVVPSNAFYYSDKIPAAYQRITPRENQYTWYSQKAIDMKMNYIDFNKWFLEIKDTASYPLFPKYGTHYSYYSAVMVADSMVRYMEELKGLDFPDIRIDSLYIEPARPLESDLRELANLWDPPKNEIIPWPVLGFDTAGKTRPRVLVVGDSFFWPVSNLLIPQNVFTDLDYWFYNTTVWPASFNNYTLSRDIELGQKLNNLDYIVVYSSASLLGNYMYGFIDRLYDYFCNPQKYDRDYYSRYKAQNYVKWLQAVLSNHEWQMQIREKATQNKISYHQQLHKDILWIMGH